MKKRHKTKKNGLSNSRYCHDCLSYDCNPMFYEDTIATRKRRYRRENGLCEACGNKECVCKSKEINKINYRGSR